MGSVYSFTPLVLAHVLDSLWIFHLDFDGSFLELISFPDCKVMRKCPIVSDLRFVNNCFAFFNALFRCLCGCLFVISLTVRYNLFAIHRSYFSITMRKDTSSKRTHMQEPLEIVISSFSNPEKIFKIIIPAGK
jgi:hypothetical protein